MPVRFRSDRVRFAQDFSKGGRTKQSFKAECDIKNIMKRFEKTGQVAHLARNPGAYMDLPEESDYQEAMNIVLQAERAFAALPSKVRQRFDNDPRVFLEFVDLGDRAALAELGLLSPEAAEKFAREKAAAAAAAASVPSGEVKK